jgi:hypothetical protein
MTEILALAQSLLATGTDLVAAFNRALAGHFGRTIQVTIDWVLIGLLGVLALRLVRFAFDVLRFVVVPSVVISGLVSAVTTMSFVSVMPLALGAGTVFLLFKS